MSEAAAARTWKSTDSVSLSTEEKEADVPRVRLTFSGDLLHRARSSSQVPHQLERSNPNLDLLLSPGVSILAAGPTPRFEGPVSRADVADAGRAGAYRRESVRAHIPLEES